MEHDHSQIEGTQMVSASVNMPTVKCRKHREEIITNVCKDCRVAVCSACVQRDHDGHTCATWENSTRMLNNILKIDALNVECLLENVEDLSAKLVKSRDETLEIHKENIDLIKQKRDEIIAEIARQTDKLIANIDKTAATDSESYKVSIDDTHSLLTKGQKIVDNIDNSRQDPVTMVQKLEQIWNLSDDYKRCSASASQRNEKPTKYCVNIAYKDGELTFTLSPANLRAHRTQMLSRNIPAARQKIKKSKMLMPSAFEYGTVKEVSSRVHDGYVYLTTEGKTHETYRVSPAPDDPQGTPICIEPVSSEIREVAHPMICGNMCAAAYISCGIRNGRSFSHIAGIQLCNMSKLSYITSLELKEFAKIRPISHINNNECLILFNDNNRICFGIYSLTERKLSSKHNLLFSELNQWDITGPLLVTSKKDVIFFAQRSYKRRALQYSYDGNDGKTLKMPYDILNFSESAVIDNKDNIWIKTDKGHIMRFTLKGSLTLDLDLGEKVYRIMTDGAAIYVHYEDTNYVKKFEKIEVGWY